MPDSLHKLTEDELHFLINYALKLIPSSTLRDMQTAGGGKRAAALEVATDVVVAQLGKAGHEVYRPQREKGPLVG